MRTTDFDVNLSPGRDGKTLYVNIENSYTGISLTPEEALNVLKQLSKLRKRLIDISQIGNFHGTTSN